MSLSDTLKDHIVIVVMGTAVTAFGTGWAAYKAVLEASGQEPILKTRKSELETKVAQLDSCLARPAPICPPPTERLIASACPPATERIVTDTKCAETLTTLQSSATQLQQNLTECRKTLAFQSKPVDLAAVFGMGRSIANAEAAAPNSPASAQNSLNGALQNAERVHVLRGETKQAMYKAAEGSGPNSAQLSVLVDLVVSDLNSYSHNRK